MKKGRMLKDALHTARDLARIGPIDKQTLKQFNILTLSPVQDLSPKEIRAIRVGTCVSQAVFAAVLNTSVSTIQKWEIGEKKPSGPSLKLLNLIRRKGIEALS